jgi:hypothetical protein
MKNSCVVDFFLSCKLPAAVTHQTLCLSLYTVSQPHIYV